MSRMPKHLEDYVPVNVRVMEFRNKYESGRIVTECSVQDLDGSIFTLARTKIFLDSSDVVVATGSAMGIIEDAKDELEKIETKSVGRALAFFGIAADDSIASKEDMEPYVAEDETEVEEEKPAKRERSSRRSANTSTRTRSSARTRSKEDDVVEEDTDDEEYEEVKETRPRRSAGRQLR